MIILKDDENIEDLQVGGLKIIQSKSQYRFTSDAVLLANFVTNAKGKKVAELCSGSGVISILVAYKQQPEEVYALEIQPALADMAARSVSLCELDKKIKVICGDAKNSKQLIGDKFDIVICNPPYRKINSGEVQKNDNIALARHEIAITLEDVIENSAAILKTGGSLYLVHQPNRLTEIFSLCEKNGMQAKQLCLICSKVDSPATAVLVKAVKGAKSGLEILPNIVVFDQDGNYTKTVKHLYGQD